MKQLDVDVSPPAFVWNPYWIMANVTFDLDPFDLDHRHILPRVTCQIHYAKSMKITFFYLVTLTFDFDLLS